MRIEKCYGEYYIMLWCRPLVPSPVARRSGSLVIPSTSGISRTRSSRAGTIRTSSSQPCYTSHWAGLTCCCRSPTPRTTSCARATWPRALWAAASWLRAVTSTAGAKTRGGGSRRGSMTGRSLNVARISTGNCSHVAAARTVTDDDHSQSQSQHQSKHPSHLQSHHQNRSQNQS
jgi:hypothetical protein